MSSNTNQTNKAVKSEKKSKNSAVYENKLHQVSIANRQKLVYHLNVKDKASGETKNICFKPNDAKIGTKLFDWDPWIDGAAAIGSALAPELLPFIHSGKEALKHWLKGEKKEKKGKHHKESREEKKLEGAMRGAEQKRRTEPIELASLPNASHHKTLHLVNGVPHVTAFDGRSVPYTTAHKLALQRGMYSRKPDDPRFADVRLMPNLRSILDSKPPVVEATKENSLIGKNEYFKPIQQYATLPRHLSLSSDGVPVLQGDMGESMAHRPFTVVKSDSHAIIAGTELLSDLILAAGAGASGNDVVDMYINPRTFVGTKLYQESLTWLQFRFRKLIIEYIPFVGSGQAGGFIEFYTQDPNEVMLTGMAQRRNADEHDSNVDFQAFSYVACAMIPKPEDKTLYFMDATDANNDMRLVFQGRMIVTNNGVNADSSTVPMYGTFYAHYEVDFYFPTAYAGANQPFNGVINGIGDAAPALGNDVIVTNSLSSFGTVNNDDIFLAAVTPPTNGTNCQWVSPLGRVTNVVAGQQIVLGVVGKGSGSNWNLKMFQSIGDAAAGTNALQYAGTLPGASATWAFPNISKVSPNMLVLFKGTDDILLHEQFEQVPLGNPLVKTPPISTPEPLTASEISIIATRRHQNKERGMPSTSLPSFKTTSPNF